MKLRMMSIGLGCLLCAGVAQAQQGGYETGGPTNVGTLPFHRNEVSLGVGVMAYFDGAAPGTSAAWDVRYGFNASRLLTIEGAYTGGAGSNGGGGATAATLLTGDLLVKPFRGERFNPFALAGAGWGNYATSRNGPSDNGTVAVPLGVGAMYRVTDRLTADGRFTYNMTFADQMGPTRADLDNWTLIGRVGADF